MMVDKQKLVDMLLRLTLMENGLVSMDAVIANIQNFPAAQPEPCEDAVSRQAAIDAFYAIRERENVPDTYGMMFCDIERILEQLPPVTPKQLEISDGTLWIMSDRLDDINRVIVEDGKIFCKQFYQDAQPEQKWIPVTENTLPDKNRVVVVCGEIGTWDYGTYRGHHEDNIHFWNWKKNTYKRVYWWMYKEDAFTYPISPMPSNAK